MASERRTVLIVDDNDMGRELAHDVLADAGYEVHDAATVADALALVAAYAPDVVVLDWHLKGATGAAVLDHLRTEDGRPGVGVLVVTADVRPELRAAALAGGADAVLAKPYRAAALTDAVAALLGCDTD